MKKMKSLKMLKDAGNESNVPSTPSVDAPSENADSPSDDGYDKKYDHHELKQMAHTIMEAHEHMADPKLMAQLQPHLDKKKKAVKSIDDLRDMAKKKGLS